MLGKYERIKGNHVKYETSREETFFLKKKLDNTK